MKPKRLHKAASEASLRPKYSSKKSAQASRRNINSVGDDSQTIKSSFHICAGCRKPIRKDRFLLKACDRYWHEDCLKCDQCHGRLGELGSTLYRKSNLNLCRRDYLEMFGETGICSVCEQIIRPSEMVMRAKQNVYHLECFACQLCNQRFCVGDRFYLCENKVVCEYDYEEHILPIQRSMIDQVSEQSYSTTFTPTEHEPNLSLSADIPTSDDQIEGENTNEDSLRIGQEIRIEEAVGVSLADEKVVMEMKQSSSREDLPEIEALTASL